MWSDEQKCRGCNREEDTQKHRLHHCLQKPDWENGNKERTQSKEDWKWQTGVTLHPLKGSSWKNSYFSIRRWMSEKYKSCRIPVEGFWNHVVTNGSLFGISGRLSAYGWSVVQIMMRRSGQYMGCTERWMLSLRCSGVAGTKLSLDEMFILESSTGSDLLANAPRCPRR